MPFPFRWIGVIVLQFFSGLAFSQLTITSPVPRMVFQRNLANEANVAITGISSSSAVTIEARFVPMAVGQGNVTNWTPLKFLPQSTAFYGQVTVSAGWYRLDVRSRSGTTILNQTQINRVGVGEVFIIAGQSNADGGFERVPNAADDRVMCVDFRQDSLSEQLLPLQFSHVSYGTNIGPSQPPHIYGILGDKLAQRLNVPILFLGAALGGTSSNDWRQSAGGNMGNSRNSAVYRRMGAVLLHYVTRTGARAVLWHQGESDLHTSMQTYYNNINYVIEKSRQQLGGRPLAWAVSRVSYFFGQTNPSVIAAQNQLISSVFNVFAGPATDGITGSDNRNDDLHFSGNGLFRFASAWDESLTASFFQTALPVMPSDSASLITSGYTIPLTRRPGETVGVASVRSDAHESDNKYVAQIIRASDGALMYESSPSTDNPIPVVLPFTLANGSYRLRTRSTHPAILGTPGEPFAVQQDATPQPQPPMLRLPVSGGTADTTIRRFGYRFESGAHAFFGLIQASSPVEVRLESLDGSGFNDSNWHLAPPSSQAPDYDPFADFNYIRLYMPISGGVGGVIPGRYRFSVRRQGSTGPGLWFETTLLDGRNILYYPMEPIGAVPPVLTITNSVAPCQVNSFAVAVDVAESAVKTDNVFSVKLSAANGSFANETTIGSGTTSPISVSLSPTIPAGANYRIRVVASNPAVASAPSQSFSICAGADLSMNMVISNRTLETSQPVTLTVVLANAGPMDATNVQASSILPDGMDFVDAASGAISAAAKTVSINAGDLLNGASKSFVFRIKASKTGTFFTSAQITASNQFDPDSQPNSGTGSGQDDEATVDFRTPNSGTFISVSPNPGQVPLPPVQSSQPPTDATKADLSLAIATNTLVVSANQTIDIPLAVRNSGGAGATNVSVQALLPTGWQLTTTTGLTVNGQTVTGSIGSIAVGSTGTLVLSVKVGQAGTLQAQVAGASPADPDSTPANGYNKGEDDEARLSLRVK
ncbi:sialate O-acetylesterase [Spirosoma fluviale]|uniref:Conserved repeat domain-containing protein n=1 Tax=Spirosoma fluviale TaxID=1597977 RepID=A0A286G346_9BACT|nr:sialate O-acetylesterase [Spirosoma fluviale]SOD89908.1 conserved repeat domain-containing protein [Spirosoma fluviale]